MVPRATSVCFTPTTARETCHVHRTHHLSSRGCPPHRYSRLSFASPLLLPATTSFLFFFADSFPRPPPPPPPAHPPSFYHRSRTLFLSPFLSTSPPPLSLSLAIPLSLALSRPFTFSFFLSLSLYLSLALSPFKDSTAATPFLRNFYSTLAFAPDIADLIYRFPRFFFSSSNPPFHHSLLSTFAKLYLFMYFTVFRSSLPPLSPALVTRN